VPARRHRLIAIVPLVEGVPGSRQTPLGHRHRACRHLERVKDLRLEAKALKEVVVDLTLEAIASAGQVQLGKTRRDAIENGWVS
jgi:hypothetical protein